MTRALATFLVAVLVVLAGCSTALGPDAGEPTAETTSPPETTNSDESPSTSDDTTGETTTGETTSDSSDGSDEETPRGDRLGIEGGVAYDASLNVTPEDGLNETELAAVVNRTMARVERIRKLEFEQTVPVEVITRAEYRNRSVFTGDSPPAVENFRSQIWEATFVIGEDESVSEAFSTLYGGAVAGYYSPSQNQIVIVSDSETPKLDTVTLAHELIHALQDQHFGYEGARTRDGRTAAQGLTEGDARYVDTLYNERCDAAWSCLPEPETSGGGGGGEINRALFVSIYQPYADGSGFVHQLRQRGGWKAVNQAYENRPVSTEQTIHPEKYPDERPVDVRVSDRSNRDWSRFNVRGGSERMGELGVYTMLWASNTIDQDRYYSDSEPYSSRNYTAVASEGWAGDRLVPYKNDASDEFGYVWKLRWDTERDATEFVRSYRKLLTKRLGAVAVDGRDGVYRLDTGGFADAFRIERSGKTVVITNAPTVKALNGVRKAS